MIAIADQTRPSVFPSDVPEAESIPSVLNVTNTGVAALNVDRCQFGSHFVTSSASDLGDPLVAYTGPSLGRIPAFFTAQTVQTLIDEGFESFDSTTLGGASDPVWSIVMELSEALAEISALANRIAFSMSRMEALIADVETNDDDSGDAVVFGEPHRRDRVRGRMIGSRRGEPLIVAEDFAE